MRLKFNQKMISISQIALNKSNKGLTNYIFNLVFRREPYSLRSGNIALVKVIKFTLT